jgi:hypothetical protein
MKKLSKAIKLLAMYKVGFGEESGLESHESIFIDNVYRNLDFNAPEAELTEGQQENIKNLYKKYILIEWPK